MPVAQQPLSVTSVRNPSFFRQNRSTVTATATREMVTSVSIGDSRSQQFRSINVIEYETRSQATLSVGRQQPATSASVRSLSSNRQNRSMGETVSVGTTTESRRSADAIGHETERKFQSAWLVSRQPMTSALIPTRSPSSVGPNRSTETASVGTAGASNSQLQSVDDATRYVPPLVGYRRLTNRIISVLGKKDRSPSSLDDQSCCSTTATSCQASIRSLKRTSTIHEVCLYCISIQSSVTTAPQNPNFKIVGRKV